MLTIPFGFGINFLTRIKPGNIIWLAITIGLGFELYQLLMSLVFRSGIRAVDINDSILNGTGVLLGYVLFRVFAWVNLKVTKRFEIKHKWLFAYIYIVFLSKPRLLLINNNHLTTAPVESISIAYSLRQTIRRRSCEGVLLPLLVSLRQIVESF